MGYFPLLCFHSSYFSYLECPAFNHLTFCQPSIHIHIHSIHSSRATRPQGRHCATGQGRYKETSGLPLPLQGKIQASCWTTVSHCSRLSSAGTRSMALLLSARRSAEEFVWMSFFNLQNFPVSGYNYYAHFMTEETEA